MARDARESKRHADAAAVFPAAAREGAGDVAVVIAFLQVLALVELPLAARDRQFHLRPAALEVHLQGHQGAAFLQGAAEEAVDFAFLEEQLAGPPRVVAELVGLGVGADVHVVEENLAAADAGEGVVEVALALAEGLDLGALEHQARLDRVDDEEVVPGLLVAGARRLGRGGFHGRIIPAAPAGGTGLILQRTARLGAVGLRTHRAEKRGCLSDAAGCEARGRCQRRIEREFTEVCGTAAPMGCAASGSRFPVLRARFSAPPPAEAGRAGLAQTAPRGALRRVSAQLGARGGR